MSQSTAQQSSDQAVRLSPAAAAQLDQLFREHNGHVVGVAVAQLRAAGQSTDLAQDIAQSAWMSIIPLLARGETIVHPRGFLAAVVRRRAIDYWRLTTTRTEQPADWSDALTSRALPPVPPADAEALCLGDLTTRQATVLRLAAQGVSQRDIVRRTGQSKGAIWRDLTSGARALRLAA